MAAIEWELQDKKRKNKLIKASLNRSTVENKKAPIPQGTEDGETPISIATPNSQESDEHPMAKIITNVDNLYHLIAGTSSTRKGGDEQNK